MRSFACALLLMFGAGLAHTPRHSPEVTPPATPMLAATPPMGWSTWNHYAHNISDKLIREQADAMVASGMRDAGYVYVHIDGGWEGQRDAQGVLHPLPSFPDMKALGDYIHSKGLKFGLYSGPGPVTCAGAEASYGHEEQDARMFASWGVDYLKYDLCSYRMIMQIESGGDVTKAESMMRAAYEKMHQAILKTGRPMVFSLCQYGLGEVWEWGPQVGANMWRTSNDINATYERMMSIADRQSGLSRFAGPGHWNDPDFLEVGNSGMTFEEQKSHFSLWALMAAPLMTGTDLTNMSEQTKSILLNRDVIAVDQDPLGKAGDRVWQQGPLEVWARPLSGGAVAVGLFNQLTSATHITVNLADLGVHGDAEAEDLWAHQSVGVLHQSYTAVVPGHGVVMLRLRRAHS
ncbi:MAG TPA: glycoside hydrolase family 27 protein [Bryocella sp.]|nr:glycoside hydrolase family 27 protein [Bryocella sp.]